MRLSCNFHLPKWVLGVGWAQSNGTGGMSRLDARCLIISTHTHGGGGRHPQHTGSCVRWCEAGSAADLRCVPCLTPSLPENTDGAASSSSAKTPGALNVCAQRSPQPAVVALLQRARFTVGMLWNSLHAGITRITPTFVLDESRCSHGS